MTGESDLYAEWVNGHPPCDPAIDRAAVLLIAKAYDTTVLDTPSQHYIARLVDQIEALPSEPHPDAILAVWEPLVEALSSLGLRQTGGQYDRMRSLAAGTPNADEVYTRAHHRFDTIHGPKAEAEMDRLYAEGIDPATGKDLEPGWLHLHIPGEFPEIEEAARRWAENELANGRPI